MGDQTIAWPLTTQDNTNRNSPTDIHASNAIRIHDPSVWAGEDISCLGPRGLCDRQVFVYLYNLLVIHSVMLSVAYIIYRWRIRCLVNNELERVRTKAVLTWGTFLKLPRRNWKITKNLSQDIRSRVQYLNPRSSRYEAGILHTRPQL
jgi:hypothetical protein